MSKYIFLLKLTKFIIDYFNITDIKITNGKETLLKNTNIKIVKPIIYKIKKLTILYYKCEDTKERKYYIPKLKQDYTLSELKSYLKEKQRMFHLINGKSN